MAMIDCIRNVLQKFPEASTADVQELYDSMTGNLQRAFMDGLGNPKSEYAAAAEKALTDHVRMVQNLATEAKDNLAKRATREAFYKNFKSKPEAMRALSLKIGNGLQKATRNALNEAFVRDLDEKSNPGVTRIFLSGDLDREIFQAAHELAGGVEKPGPRTKETIVIANAVHNLNRLELHYWNESGAHINDLEGHIAHQGHDPKEFRGTGEDIDAAREEWKEDILPLLDEKKTFHRSFFKIDQDELLDSIFNNVVEEKHKTLQSEAADQFVKIIGTPSNMARRAEMGKKLYFKDGYAQYDYNQMYGKKTLAEQVNSTISTTARNTGMMQELGTNPKAAWLRDQIGMNDPEKVRLARYMAEMDGSTSFLGNSTGAAVSETARQTLNMAKLMFSLPAHFGTVMTRASVLMSGGENYLSAHQKSIMSFFENIPEEHKLETMRTTLIGADARIAKIWGDLYNGDGAWGKMAKANEFAFKANGMTYFIENSRLATGQMLAAQLGEAAGKGFSKIDHGLARSLMRWNIDPVAWELMRASVKDTERGPVIGHDGVRDIPFDQALGIMQKGGKIPAEAKPAEVKRLVEKFKFDTQQRIAAYFADRVDTAMGTPGVRERADYLRRGTLADTVGGQALRFVAQFKAYPISMMTRWGDFAVNELLADKTHFEKVGTVTGLAASSIALGYLGLSMSEMMKGKTPPDPTHPDTWMKAAAKGGALGYFGDFLIQNMEDKGKMHGALSSLAGPTLGQLDDVLDIGKDLLAKDKPLSKAGAQAYRVAKNNAPGPWNFPFMKPAMEQLFLNELAERMNPGYLQRQRTKLKESGQSDIFGH